MTILAANQWGTNARMMEDVARLYINLSKDVVLDPTYGKGGFWKRVRPIYLIASDRYTEADHDWDFTQLPLIPEVIDVVTFDPAYVTPGGRETSTIPEMNNAYGMDTARRTLSEQWELIVAGMEECHRVLAPKGLLMQKGMNYISSGRYHDYRHAITAKMLAMGMELTDEFILTRKAGGPQPRGRGQKHARNNYSFLIIGRKK